jgi:amino acid transporter
MMVFVCPILYLGWKVVKRTKFIKPEEADLVWERPVIDAYEANVAEKYMTFWEECKMMMGFKKNGEEHLE